MEEIKCETIHSHDLTAIKNSAPNESEFILLSELFKMFSDPTRIKILYSLIGNELCVCDIASLLDMTISAISHQLRLLKQARLVKFRKEGQTVFYSLADDHVLKIIGQGIEHINE